MGLAKTAMVFFFITKVVCELSMAMGATVYKVGDAAGWTIIGNVDFNSWAASKNFHVGDTIRSYLAKCLCLTFNVYLPLDASVKVTVSTGGTVSGLYSRLYSIFEYNKEFHNVVRVTHKNFNACNSTAPYATFATGNDSFTIKRPGHFYFICGYPGHCERGQKVDIRVIAPSKSVPAPSPTPSESMPPSHPSSSPSVLPKFPSPTVSPSPVEAPVPSAHAPHRNGGISLYSSWKHWVPATVMVLSFGLSPVAF